jgi:exoribonuclease R
MTFRYYPPYIKSYTVDNISCLEATVQNGKAVMADGRSYHISESNRALEGDKVIVTINPASVCDASVCDASVCDASVCDASSCDASVCDASVAVIDVTRRARNLIAGIIYVSSGSKKYGRTSRGLTIYEFHPLSSRFPSFRVPSSMVSGQPDQYVVIEFHEWPEYNAQPQGVLVRSLGPVTCPVAEDLALRYKNMIYRKRYDPRTIQHALSFCQDAIDRLNLPLDDRPVYSNTISIDPDGSTDLDDAFSVGIDGRSIQVHIADVDYYLPSHNPLEAIMRERITSIYGNSVDHLLPDTFAAELISLKPDYRRVLCPVITIRMEYTGDDLQGVSAHLAYIKPTEGRQLTYERAQLLLDNGDSHLQIAARMTRQTDTHKIVECLMVKANNYVGQHLQKYGTILRTMDARQIDIQLLPDAIRFIGFKNPASYSLSTTSPDLHAALGLRGYTHFTSPIRRYVDLLVHRQLKAVLAEQTDRGIAADQCYVTHLNSYLRNTRHYYRDRSTMQLLAKLEGCSTVTPAYIIAYNRPYVVVHLPIFACEYSYPLLSQKLNNIIAVTESTTSILIINPGKGDSIMLNKYSQIEVILTPMPTVAHIKGRVVMTIPYLRDFLSTVGQKD